MKSTKPLTIILIIVSAIAALGFLFCGFCIVNMVESYNESPHYELNEEKYGNPYGRDYRGHVGDGRYSLTHIAGVDVLETRDSPSYSGEILLENTYDHFFDKYHNLYVSSADGYAVIYPQSNLCKILLKTPHEIIANDKKTISRRTPENNYRIRKATDKSVIYLDSLDEFTEHEQKMLKRLKSYKLNKEL